MLAVITMPARDAERDHHTVARFEFRYCFADLDHFSHEFMAEDVSCLHRRDGTVVQVEVRAADRGGAYFQDGITRIKNLGIGHRFHPHVFLSIPANGSHFRLLFLCAAPAGCPSVVGISPVSMRALNLPKSSSTWSSGSSPYRVARNTPNFPIGGT